MFRTAFLAQGTIKMQITRNYTKIQNYDHNDQVYVLGIMSILNKVLPITTAVHYI